MARSFSIIQKSITQLPIRETLNYLVYQGKLRSGLLRLQTPTKSKYEDFANFHFQNHWFDFLSPNAEESGGLPQATRIVHIANNICEDKIVLFGGEEVELDLKPNTPLNHWSQLDYHAGNSEHEDIKYTWEPARFGWAIRLGQAFLITGKEAYANHFWNKYSTFRDQNPLNLGPNWESSQEIALRLIAWVVALHLIAESKTMTEKNLLRVNRDIADHAARIMPSLSYAKAQNNNHILSEAAGLYTAGTFLFHHHDAEKWREIGLKIFEQAIQRQIDENGEYIQHSTNYHRFMLTISIWMMQLAAFNDTELKEITISKIQQAIFWISNLLDPQSGKVPNLGHNDGSLILPFSICNFNDYRPIIQAASALFLKDTLFEQGIYNDLAFWMGIEITENKDDPHNQPHRSPRIGNDTSWATLRAAHYESRPAHADQLHVDLWFKGNNILLDAGTYQYNAPPPWNNGLAKTCVHNTITLANSDQMTRGGRFLWLDWAQAHISEYDKKHITAAHDGYLRVGAVHARELLNINNSHWRVVDRLLKLKAAKDAVKIDMNWLMPDWNFIISDNRILLDAPFGKIQLAIKVKVNRKDLSPQITIYRAGRAIDDPKNTKPLLGWYSPTYGIKEPALSIVYAIQEKLPVTITTDFFFG